MQYPQSVSSPQMHSAADLWKWKRLVAPLAVLLAIHVGLCAPYWNATTSRLLAADLAAAAPGPATDGKQKEKSAAAGMPRRVPWTTSRVVGNPEPPFPYRVQRAFPAQKFEKPVYMIPEPGTDRIFILQYPGGTVYAIKDDPQSSSRTEIFRFPGDKKSPAECLSLIFHPDYLRNRQVFLFVNQYPDGPSMPKRDQIYRLTVSKTAPFAILPESRQLIIEWTSNGHDGGDMAFGADGCLYITAGDGTSGSDPDITGQDLTDLRGSVLRIDVDHPEQGKPYRVPKDNPFLHVPGARPEIWAFGLRNPWRMSFDRPTGNLWVGDVGQDLWELIHLIRRGGNYGWSVMEGSHPFYPERKIGPAPILRPIVEHHHSEARSITGGYVYHGKRFPELAEHYLYCCYQTGTVWGFRYEQGRVLDHRVLADSSYNCAAWGLDHAGELYLVALSGEILQLERNPASVAGAPRFPTRLSDTGLFASVRELRPAPGVIPYSVNAPGWHDGAGLSRHLAIPHDDKINAGTSRGWEFADGAVLVQTLSLEMEAGNSASSRNIETRLLTRQGGEWFAYTYEWDDGQSDAHLVPKQGKERVLQVRDASAPGGTRKRTWRYLSRSECMTCHSRAANFVLGLSTLQMNRTHKYERVEANQLETLNAAGYFAPPLSGAAGSLGRLPDPYDPKAAVEPRVRAYLHANCSHCHVADGGGNARMELEFKTERDKMNVIGVPPLQGAFGIPDAELVAPGDPYRSVLLYRLSKLGGGRMPLVGSSVVDHRAVDLLHGWIQSLPAKGPAAAAQARLAEQRRHEERAIASLVAYATGKPSPNESVSHLLSSTSGSMRLVRALVERRLQPAVETAVIETGSAHPNPAVRDLFERFVPEEKRIKRLGRSIDAAALLVIPGSAERGRDLFFRTAGVTCQNCHQIHGAGRDVGPNLSQIGKKYNRAQILENLIDPSKTIEEKYTVFVVQTDRGKSFTGIVTERTAEWLSIKDAQGTVVKIARKEVDSLEPQKKSLMPDDLLADLTAQQAADLLAFLESLK